MLLAGLVSDVTFCISAPHPSAERDGGRGPRVQAGSALAHWMDRHGFTDVRAPDLTGKTPLHIAVQDAKTVGTMVPVLSELLGLLTPEEPSTQPRRAGRRRTLDALLACAMLPHAVFACPCHPVLVCMFLCKPVLAVSWLPAIQYL